MLLQQLVQNYYERVGSFFGIEKTFIAKELYSLVDSKELPLMEICYQLVGYKPDSEYHLSAHQVAGARSAWLLRNKAELQKYFGKVEFSVYEERMKGYGMPDTSIRLCDKYSTYFKSNLSRLFYEYYKSSTNCMLPQGGYLIPLRDYLITQRVRGIQKNQLSIEKLMKKLPKLEICTGRKYTRPIIVNNVLYTSESLLTENLQKIQVDVLSLLIHQMHRVPIAVLKNVMDIPLLASHDLKKYLCLLDCARAYGITLEELVSVYDIQIPNEMIPAEILGMSVKLIGESVFFETWDSTEGYAKVSAEQFNEMFFKWTQQQDTGETEVHVDALCSF